jgi:predicted RNase H-like HicB family nuclease
MVREFSVIIERDAEGYYVATVPALRGCHTQAKSLDTLLERIREAIELCLELEHLREYIQDLQDDLIWDALFKRTQDQLVAVARWARAEIAMGRAEPMDFERL